MAGAAPGGWKSQGWVVRRGAAGLSGLFPWGIPVVPELPKLLTAPVCIPYPNPAALGRWDVGQSAEPGDQTLCPLPRDGAHQGSLVPSYSQGSSSFLGKDLLEAKHVPMESTSWCPALQQSLDASLIPGCLLVLRSLWRGWSCCRSHVMEPPLPSRWWHQVGVKLGTMPGCPPKPCHAHTTAVLALFGAVGGMGPRGLAHLAPAPVPALSGLIRRRISRPRSLSPDLINGPFISTLKESAIFCLLN